MKKFAISIHLQAFNSPPIAEELARIDRTIAKTPVVVDNEHLDTFTRLVGERGNVFCPSTFQDGKKSRETFEQSQLFVLSFDGYKNEDAVFARIKARAKRYGLPILLAYDTRKYYWEETEHEQFNVVFMHETPITDLREAEAIQLALMMIFPEADKDCSILKPSRGGNRLLYASKKMCAFNAEWLLMNMCLFWKDRYGPTNYKRKLAEYARITGIKLDDRNLPEISITEVHDKDLVENHENHEDGKNDKNSTNCNIDIPSDGILSNLNYKINFRDINDNNSSDSSKIHDTQGDGSAQRTYSTYSPELLETLGSICGLYREFESGSRKLTQQELLGLATNLSQIRSGQKKFNAVLGSIYEGLELLSNWAYYFFFIRGKGSKPCSHFCPYHNVCQHGKNILSTAKPQYHQIERLANWGEPLVDLEEAWEDFKDKFEEAIGSDDRIWHIIKSQTALGKTQAVLEFLLHTKLRVLVVVPTNKLKREINERARKMGFGMAVSPSYHELEDELSEDDWEAIQALLDAGKSPAPLIEKWIEMAESDQKISREKLKRAKLFKRYKRELAEFYSSKGLAITTHRRLPSMDLSKYDLVIIDEDILYSVVIPNRETVSISALKDLKKEQSPKDPLAVKIKEILNKRRKIKKDGNSEYFTLQGIDYDEEYGNIEMGINIRALCYANFFCYREPSEQDKNLEEDSVTFVKEVKFPEETKYIMLSATANKKICELYFGEENVRFYKCKEAEITGSLLQHADKPMGRRSIRKDLSIFKRIRKYTGAEDTISFKEFHPYYTGDLHFGNCAGYDTLKGHNIDVIGTPHQPEWVYKLFAYSLGYDVDDKLKPNIPVVHNGFKFRFMTYEDEVLRTIQFYMIETDLEQAVGRARPLRCNCTINLFSDFPLKQAELRESEYDKEEPDEQKNS